MRQQCIHSEMPSIATLESYTSTTSLSDMKQTYSDLEAPRDISVWKMASEVPSTTPTAIIAG